MNIGLPAKNATKKRRMTKKTLNIVQEKGLSLLFEMTILINMQPYLARNGIPL